MQRTPYRRSTSAEVTIDTGEGEQPSGFAHDYHGQIGPDGPTLEAHAAAEKTAQLMP